MSYLNDYIEAKDRLFIKVVNYEDNQNYIITLPHQQVDDLAVTYHLTTNGDLVRSPSVTIDYSMLNVYGIDADQLHRDAVANSAIIRPVEIHPLLDMIEPDFADEVNDPSGQVLVVTNRNNRDGAAALFYPDVMEDLSNRFGGDFYMLPSSKHEVIVLPTAFGHTASELENMVREVNEAIVSKDDQLSNHAYRYDSQKHSLSIAKDETITPEQISKVSEGDSLSRMTDKPQTKSVKITFF